MSHENTANVLTISNEPFPPQNLSSSTSSSTTTTDQKQLSKLILRSALQKANVAVQCDSNNDVLGAINAYKEAITLLERVLSTVEKDNDKQRLMSIHDSYSERIRLLSSITKVEEETKVHSRSSSLSKSMIRKVTSNSSIESTPQSPVTHWQDNNSNWSVKQQPTFQMQASKSTPTRQPRQSIDHGDGDDEEEDSDPEFNISPVPAMRPPPRNSSRLLANKRRSSVSSDDSIISSEDSIVEQPAMALPSLKTEESTPVPKIKTAFRARTSSLPKPPLMQRSSSMSTVETITSPLSPISDSDKPLPLTEDVDPSSQPYPPQMLMNRPIVSRPSVGGLGSMRRKAANRLSMEGFIRKDKSNGTYGFLIKDHPDELEVEQPNNTSQLKLLFALEKSMTEGAHITQKLYIPKNLWQQPNIRLSSMDIKAQACESLINDMNKLENWTYLDDLTSSSRLLDHFETSVDHLQMSLSKKLKRESTSLENNKENGSRQSNSASIHHSSSRDSMSAIGRMDGKKTQSFMSWGTKLTKSVEKMNAFSLTKTEDQYKNYIEVLQRFLIKIHVLEHWLNHYRAEKTKSRQPQHDVLITKLNKVCTVINNVIGGFIIKDITVLLAKWLKRGGSWVNE